MSVIGQNLARIDAESKVKGQAIYPGDINLPGQAYMRVLFSNRPHAIVKSVEISEAENMEGVLGVFTARDVPNNEHGLIPDHPVLCGPGAKKPFTDRVRSVGDQVAIVVAESEKICKAALNKIKVEYEDLPIITDPIISMQKDAYRIHPERDSNIFGHYQIRKGNPEEAFKSCDVIVTSEYKTPVQEHAYLQPEAGISYWDEEGRIVVAVAGQWAHEEQERIAHALELPHEKIRVIHPAIGGAFGGREDISIQIVLALAVYKLNQKGISRPIKIIWSREESIIGHCKRHPYIIKTRWGATKEGKILAAEVELVADGGAYALTSMKVMGNATFSCTGPYEIPHVKVDSFAVYTNNLQSAAFRGFGGPQGAFAAESQMNKLAKLLNIDPVEIRMKNLLKEGALSSVGSPLPEGISIHHVLADCAKASGWRLSDQKWVREGGYASAVPEKEHLRKGIGISCAFKNVAFSFGSPEQCTATIEIHGESAIDYAVLRHASADVGQGTHTVLLQMAGQALNLPVEKIQFIRADTSLTKDSGSVSASRMTFMAGNAIIGAAREALEKWNCEERPAIATFQYIPPKTTMFDPQTGACDPNISYGYVAESAEIEVDLETGEVRIVKVVCSDDVGKAINPKLVEGQIEGGVVQAAGYAVLENFIQRDGQVLTKSLSTYLIPTVLDIPDEVEARILEYHNPTGPWGARGMGEMPLLPLTPAITAALYEATGVWVDEFPLTSERVLFNLEKSRLGQA
jgi:CO/xanthine dehydrogenase Mo-binding subunit